MRTAPPHRILPLSRPAPLAAWLALALSAVHAAVPTASPRGGTIHVVSNCNDTGAGSLREAASTLAASGDTVDLSALACSTISLVTGAIDVAVDDLTIIGAGSAALTIDGGAGAGQHDRVLDHSGSGTFVLEGLTVANAHYTGAAEPRGGCIQSQGFVLLYGMHVQGCSIANTGNEVAKGGAIYAELGLVMTDSVISGNSLTSQSADAHGGGVFAESGVLGMKYTSIMDNSVEATAPHVGNGGGATARQGVVIDWSTIAGNHASGCCGGLNASGFASYATVIANSTVSGNSAGRIGGLFSRPALQLSNSTIAFNAATDAAPAGGIELYASSGPHALQSSIVAGNTAGGSAADLSGEDVSGGDNLVFAVASGISYPVDTLTGVDPLLAPLADNGGATLTHAIDASSPAFDAGNNASAYATDQRGEGHPREIGIAADIGAFEFDPDRIFADGFD